MRDRSSLSVLIHSSSTGECSSSGFRAATQPKKACAKIDWRSVSILCSCFSISVLRRSNIELIADSLFNDQLQFNRPTQQDNQRLNHAGVDADGAGCRLAVVLNMGSQRLAWQAYRKKMRSSTLGLERIWIRKTETTNCSCASDLVGRLAIMALFPGVASQPLRTTGSLPLDRARCQPGYDLPLEHEHEEEKRRRDGHRGSDCLDLVGSRGLAIEHVRDGGDHRHVLRVQE